MAAGGIFGNAKGQQAFNEDERILTVAVMY